MPKTWTISPKWRNLAKYGHTAQPLNGEPKNWNFFAAFYNQKLTSKSSKNEQRFLSPYLSTNLVRRHKSQYNASAKNDYDVITYYVDAWQLQ